MAFQRLTHAQHPGGAIGHLQSDAHACCVRQAGKQVGVLPGKAAQRPAGAIGKMVGHRAAAHQRRGIEPHTAQNGTHCPGRALREHRKTAAAADEQLQHVPHNLSQVSIRSQQQVIQITQYKPLVQLVHRFPLLSVARK
ncbi:MAG: hypothetical protein ACLS5S_00745 [Faecalibacterium sp.]